MTLNVTELNAEDNFHESVGVVGMTVVLLGAVASCVGCVGNYLSYQTAEFLPEATTKYLIKHLAVWDSVTLIQVALFQNLYLIFVPQTALFQVKNFHDFAV